MRVQLIKYRDFTEKFETRDDMSLIYKWIKILKVCKE